MHHKLGISVDKIDNNRQRKYEIEYQSETLVYMWIRINLHLTLKYIVRPVPYLDRIRIYRAIDLFGLEFSHN